MKHLYVSWIDFQRRPASMRSAVGYELRFIPPPFETRLLKPLGYLWQAAVTAATLLRMRPDVVWFQAPPNFLVHMMWLARLLACGRLLLVADCHNAALRAPWSTVPFTTALLNRMDLVLAHNRQALAQARALGITTPRLQLLETRPAQFEHRVDALQATHPTVAARTVLVPLSFGADEPVDIVLAAAADLPDVTFLLTGHIAKAKAMGYVARAPANVRFTGQVDVGEYDRLLLGCDVVLGLTAFEGIQLSAANEAVGASKPLVLSDTKILRELFGSAAVFARNEPRAIAQAIDAAFEELDALGARSRALAGARELRWFDQLVHALGAAELKVAGPTAGEDGAARPAAACHEEVRL